MLTVAQSHLSMSLFTKVKKVIKEDQKENLPQGVNKYICQDSDSDDDQGSNSNGSFIELEENFDKNLMSDNLKDSSDLVDYDLV